MFLSEEVNGNIHPVGSQRPKMYGSPKIHKVDIPLKYILSMVSSVQHRLVKWLIEVPDPVLDFYLENCVPDSFQFTSFMRKLQPTIDTGYFMPFDISSYKCPA